jgi:hypothetical protein
MQVFLWMIARKTLRQKPLFDANSSRTRHSKERVILRAFFARRISQGIAGYPSSQKPFLRMTRSSPGLVLMKNPTLTNQRKVGALFKAGNEGPGLIAGTPALLELKKADLQLPTIGRDGESLKYSGQFCFTSAA